ncbi:hypothetical protein GEMRC1_000192 [Eukaryota sp. GEM-RC1]
MDPTSELPSEAAFTDKIVHCESLPLPSSSHCPSDHPRFQQSLLALVHLHLLRSLMKSSVSTEPNRDLLSLQQQLPTFFQKVGCVSNRFFESSLLAVKMFVESNTFQVVPEDLSEICSFASFFGAEDKPVFLHVDGIFYEEEFLKYSHIITGLELTLRHRNYFEFLHKYTLLYPLLKQLHVYVKSSISPIMFEPLKFNTVLTSIILDRRRIREKGAKALAEVLKVNTVLTNIGLATNHIDDEGAHALAVALKVNTTLRSLNLANIYIGNDGAKALADALRFNTTLASINLWGNFISDESIKALAEALKVNTSVTNFNLRHNSFSDEGFIALAEALKINTSVTSIDLGQNPVGIVGAQALADALKVNTTLRSLALSNHKYSNDYLFPSVSVLANALKINTTLTNIDLSHIGLHDSDVRYLAEALKVNTSLRRIDLEWNRIGEKRAEELAEALLVNTTVRSIILLDNSFQGLGTKIPL